MIADADIQALLLSLRLAGLSTLLLLCLATPLAWWLARSQSKLKVFIETVVALPLVLPPTVLGFYLLLALGSRGLFADASLAFSFTGLVIGSIVYSMPFVVQPLHNALASVDRATIEAAATLRATPLDRFLTVVMPQARVGFITAAVLGFTHTLGEFGVVLMIGGNIPGETRVVSIAIYEHVELLDYASAHWLSIVLLMSSFLMLLLVYTINRGINTGFSVLHK